ncbi:alpha-L-fucosidase [Chitinophaga alhagiae]|uniref:alpha-L-fucosidase n=1 Tax=Chitinophaga alhagiae TaxID=2203219 RepID=UPI000E5C275D|nr:alpha-L-fucosidase [Chitinophaga alhagiae]
MKKISALLACLLLVQCLQAQNSANDQRMKWWREARFGMFIHWGVYAVPAGMYKGYPMARGGGEWIMNRSKIPVAEYQGYARQFNPVKYNAEQWVLMAKNAGMKYIVITAKHHDGFALFNSKASQWDIADATPYGKDLLKPLAEACKKHGIKLGFYYSQAQDWNNPGGSAARKDMREGWPNPDSAKVDAYTKAHHGHWDPAQETQTFDQYINNVAVPQVKELLTNYGEVAVLWWDTPTNMTDDAAKKLQAQLALQPNIITNDRLKRPNFPGDYKTPEQKIPNLSELDGRDWETCMTMNGTWGFKSYDHKWKSVETMVRNLVDIASKGGNYLLNVGPTAEGEFPAESIKSLQGIGEWMKVNGEAVYSTKKSPLEPQPWGRITCKNNTLYLSVFEWPANGKLEVAGLKNKVKRATLLGSKQGVKANAAGNNTSFSLPAAAPNAIASVIKVELEGSL